MTKKTKKIDYFRDGSRWIASIDRGFDGIFIYHSGKDGWEFIVPGSLRYDSLHQDIYFAHHHFDPCLKGEERDLPPLPPVPKLKSLAWKDNFLPKRNLSIKAYPGVMGLLHASPEKQMRVWITLLEDEYETLLGDGCFRYFREPIYLSEFDARTAAAAGDDGGALSVTSVVIGLDGGAIVPVVFEPGIFEHYYFEKVVLALESSISSGDIAHT